MFSTHGTLDQVPFNTSIVYSYSHSSASSTQRHQIFGTNSKMRAIDRTHLLKNRKV